MIAFHLKKQPKLVMDHGYDGKYKAGQGISAWSKLLNILFSTVTRTFSRNFRGVLKDNVQLSYGSSDANLATAFGKYQNELNSTNYQKFMADFSEFDSSQDEKGVMSSCIILQACGFNDRIINFYQEMRRNWALFAIGKSDNEKYTFRILGEWMQHSGQPFTLDGNGLFNMSAIGATHDITELIFAAFKGDDSFILARKVIANLLLKECGYKIKAFNVKIAEYIANIITPSGEFFPDVIRRASRAISKIYKNDVDWRETQQSLCDCLDVIADDAALTRGCSVASMFYAQFNIHVTPEEVFAMLCWLRTLSEAKDLDSIPTSIFYVLSID
jgi:hypothetical protein